MREHLYRGKDIKTGEWRYGSLITYVLVVSQVATIVVDNGRGRALCRYLVDPETVGEWTGLYDKNKVRIFEGDVVLENGRAARVFFDEETACFSFDYKGDIYSYIHLRNCRATSSEKVVVIGNIHDGLLGGEK